MRMHDGDIDFFKGRINYWESYWTEHEGTYPATKNRRMHYEPWYDDKADYNTNAKSYYDYLARFSYLVRLLVDYINRLLNRDVKVKDTTTIDMTREGHWIGKEEWNGNDYTNDEIISADVIFSKKHKSKDYPNITGSHFDVPNGSEDFGSVWSPDYTHVLEGINADMGIIKDHLKRLDKRWDKLLANLAKSGAITTPDKDGFDFAPDRSIASGNINVFGGTPDGSSYIRTNAGQTENDITAGI